MRPRKIHHAQALEYAAGLQRRRSDGQSLSVVLGKEGNNESLHFEFFGVQKLSIQQPDLSLIKFWLEVLAGDDLPSVESNYLARDPEQGRVVSFECRDFKVCKSKNIE